MLTAFTQKTWLLTSSGLNHPPANLLYFQDPFLLTALCTCLSLLNILALSFKSPLWADSLKSTGATRREFPQAPPIHSHWSTSVQTTCTSPSSLYEWQVCEPKANFLPFTRPAISPHIRDSSCNFSIFFALSVFNCAMILIRIKSALVAKREISLCDFPPLNYAHFSAPFIAASRKKNLYLLFLSSFSHCFWTP